jgi:hypothetical protein
MIGKALSHVANVMKLLFFSYINVGYMFVE